MQPQPVTVFDTLIEELNQIRRADTLDQVALARIALQANRLKEENPGHGFSVLGAIECIKNNIEQMHKYHKLSIVYSDTAVVYLNYASSLLFHDFFEEAFDYAKKAHEKDPAYETALWILAITSEALGLEDHKEYVNKYQMLTGRKPREVEFDEDDLTRLKGGVEIAERIIENHPELVRKMDKDLFDLAEDLVNGIEVD
ncbi:hypothetical protein ACFL0Q_01210 [Thermodesulfobacteriota bacterium]